MDNAINILIVILNAIQSSHTAEVPCYLQPTSHDCHYSLKPDAPQCTNAKTKLALENDVKILNRSIFSLEEELIRLGVIPPDNACSKLPTIENGGVVYSDLNLKPGSVGKYVCNEGYYIKTLNGTREFTCTEDGIWNFKSSALPVSCVLEVKGCQHPDDITNGSISTEADIDNMLPGDMMTYICDEGFQLNGTESIFCTRNGNWSDQEPQCLKLPSADYPNGAQPFNADESKGLMVALSVTLLLLVVAVTVITVLTIKLKVLKSPGTKGVTQDLTASTSYLIVHNEDEARGHSSSKNQNENSLM